MPESPAVLLRRAANRLDGLYAPIKDERWDYDLFADGEPRVVLRDDVEWDGDDVPTVATVGAGCIGRDRGAWIAALGPQVAAPLAELLRAVAADAEAVDQQNAAARERAMRRDDNGQTFVLHRAEVGHAVAFACALLGEHPDTTQEANRG